MSDASLKCKAIQKLERSVIYRSRAWQKEAFPYARGSRKLVLPPRTSQMPKVEAPTLPASSQVMILSPVCPLAFMFCVCVVGLGGGTKQGIP